MTDGIWVIAGIVSLLILVSGAVLSYKDSRFGLISAIIAVIVAFIASSITGSFGYVVFVLAISLLNIFSLEALQNDIKGIDYGLVGLIALATMFILNTDDIAYVLTALVIVSVPTYILVMLREGAVDVEIGVKYVVFMVFATVLFLIGAIIIASGAEGIMLTLGYVMLVVGLSLEVGVAPLHEWVPDVFAAADPIPVSVIASIAKIVPFVAAFRILASTPDVEIAVISLTAVIAAFSMFAGNIGALTAREHARVLAYSTVANMGYMLTCLVAVSVSVSHVSVSHAHKEVQIAAFLGGVLLLFANAAGKIGFFNAIKGEGACSPLLYTLSFSFIGVPPLLGFWGKFFILISLVSAALAAQFHWLYWLAGILVLNSAVSIPYYIRLARELGSCWKANITNYIVAAATVITLITVFLYIPVAWFPADIGSIEISISLPAAGG